MKAIRWAKRLSIIILVPALVLTVSFFLLGPWMLAAMMTPPDPVPPEFLGWVNPEDSRDWERIQGVIRSYSSGSSAVLTGGVGSAKERCEQIEPIYGPFCFEGLATGYLARGYFRQGHHLDQMESELKALNGDRYFILYYVGLGLWGGMRHFTDMPAINQMVEALKDPRGRDMFWNGYGFSRVALWGGFGVKPTLAESCGYGADTTVKACGHGYGRGLWLQQGGNIENALKLCELRDNSLLHGACIAGVGTAASFVQPDRLERPLQVADKLTAGGRGAFDSGIRLAFLVRHQADAAFFEKSIASLPSRYREVATELLRQALKCYRDTYPRETFYNDFMTCR